MTEKRLTLTLTLPRGASQADVADALRTLAGTFDGRYRDNTPTTGDQGAHIGGVYTVNGESEPMLLTWHVDAGGAS